ncbi:MAG: hypothetical protein HZC28_17070 [Spirochaetes bacterium]|nr:hypothetical protein [Spirochaetota bacterium]
MRKAIVLCLSAITLSVIAEEPELKGLPQGTDLLGSAYHEALKLVDTSGKQATAETIEVSEPFGKALRVTVPVRSEHKSVVKLQAPLAQPIAKDDVVVLVFYARSGGNGGSEALALVECNEPKWGGTVITTARAEGDWKRFLVVGTAKQDFPAGKTVLAFQVGNKEQVIDIGGVTLLNFGTSVVYNTTTKKFRAAGSEAASSETANILMKADGRWKPLDMENIQIAPGSALDLSRFVDGPAGKYGRVTITPNGGFAFADMPGKEARFFAFNALINHLFDHPDVALAASTEEQTKENCRAYAALVKRHGYNMVRLHYVDFYLMSGSPADYECNKVNQDRFDYLVYCFKQEGIYYGVDAMSFTGLKKATWSEGVAMRYKERFLVDPSTREVWEKSVRIIMTHKNPYTKMSLAEDPALIYVTLFNEQDLGSYIGNFDHPAIRPHAEKRWREFLAKRYRNDYASLVRNWGVEASSLPAGGMFDSIPFFDKKDAYANGQRGNDIGLFLHAIESEMHTWYLETIRAIGYKGYSVLYDVISFFRHLDIHNDSSVVANHGYHALPSDGERPGSRLTQDSALTSAASYWRSRAAARILNRPFMITEYGSPYWGRYRHEEGLFYASYSALQRQDVITVHEQAAAFRSKPMLECYYGRDPIGRASQLMSAFIYKRGDVKASPHSVAVAVNEAYCVTNGAMNRTINNEQSKIALLCGFGVQYDKKYPAGLPPYAKPDLILLPADGGELVISGAVGMGGMANVVDRGDGSDLTRVIGLMKTKGILSAENRSSASKEIYQSDTGELTMYSAEAQFTVITPRLEGAVLKESGKASLNALRLVSTTTPAAVAVIALDDAAIPESRRLLLVYSTDAVNTGLETSPDRITLVKPGTLPILLETGTVKAAVKNRYAKTVKCFALGMDGQRREQIELSGAADEEIRLLIDTAALSKGPALFFEIAAE